MKINFVKRIGIGNSKLEKLLKETIGDGSKDVFIDVDEELRDIDTDNTFKLGECEVRGIKAVRKLGAVYLTDDNLGLIDAGSRIDFVAPSFKYTKGDSTTTTLEYIENYCAYKLQIDNGTKKDLYIITYVVAL